MPGNLQDQFLERNEMKNMTTVITSVFFGLLILSLPKQGVAGNIVDPDDYEYWRSLADSSAMFGAMKADAIATANEHGSEMRDVMGANALAYILDPQNKNKYVANIRDGIRNEVANIYIGDTAATSSVPSHILFHALLALDVVRNDLSNSDLKACEDILEDKIFQLFLPKWKPHAVAMRMMWHKYAGNEADFLVTKNAYDHILDTLHLTPDGVYPGGTGYGMERFNSRARSAKNTVYDLLEYMGYNEYYSNPKMRRLHEWIYGYATSPAGATIFYGDARGGRKSWDVEGDVLISHTTARAARFSDDAYRYAMWVLRHGEGLEKATLKGYLASYIAMAGSGEANNPIEFDIADARLAPSKIFTNYAALIGNSQSKDELYLSVLSLTGQQEYHTHFEANAIGMAGYGEILLRNAGYDGPSTDVSAGGLTTSARFLQRNSESGNALMIDGENHSGKYGSGLVEGIVGTDIEYFRSLNDASIKGSHNRDVVFVQAADGANGYYVVMDHVTADAAGAAINVAWHPNTAKTKTVRDEMEFRSDIEVQVGDDGPVLFGDNAVTLTTFLGTEPTTVEKKEMVNQSRGHHYPAEYLYITYPTSSNRADILTVLFPSDQNHSVGNMNRIDSEAYTGTEIAQGEVVDVALTSRGTSAGSQDSTSFTGEDVVYRTVSGDLTSYFVKGNSFRDGLEGFTSTRWVALYVRDASGKIVSPGANVTFYYPGISSVKLNGKPASTVGSGENWVAVYVPAGEHAVELQAE